MHKHTSFKRAVATFGLVLAGLAIAAGPALAAVSVTTSATANVSSDSVSGSSVALPVLTLTEGAAADIPVGTLTWGLPSGYALDNTSVANVVYTGTGLTGTSTVTFLDSTHFSVNVTATSSVAGSLTIGSITPLKVKVTSGSPMAAAGNLMLTSGSLTGLTGSTSFGLLAQVAGTPNKLAFTVQPPVSVTAGNNFSTTVAVEDQFGNVVGSDAGRSIKIWAANGSNPSIAATSSLSGTTTLTDASGMASFTNLSYPMADSIKLSATSSALNNALSNLVSITAATSTPTPPPISQCNLHNGMLVKFPGDATIYMVVNCVLRPFTTPAIFHARGKKFQDIQELFGKNAKLFFLGRPIGEGNDDDSSIISPPSTSTSTPPSFANLPEGSVVKVPGNPTVYILTNGQLQPIPSLFVFKSFHKSFADVKTISTSTLSSLTLGAAATFPDGTLLKGSNHTVYVVKGGQLFAIPSLTVFKKHGWSFSDVLNVDDHEINSRRHGGNED